jgi:hypothetical protein
MTSALILPIGFLLGITAWSIGLQFLRQQQAWRKQEIVRRGACCQGKVVAIQRPSMVDACTRLYVDFEPPGATRTIRVCHAERGPVRESAASLLHTGETVNVHYLPHRPWQAVITDLV